MTSIKDPNELLQELDLLNGEILKIDENLIELNKAIIEQLQRINKLKFQIEASEKRLKKLLKDRKVFRRYLHHHHYNNKLICNLLRILFFQNCIRRK